jgi:lysophospholipase L1-like esterase
MSALAAHWGIAFLDAGALIGTSPIDGVHFSAESHAILGAAVAEKVRNL